MPKATPNIVTVPSANYIAVRGQGDPNEKSDEYAKAIGTLYAVAFTIKMSYRGEHKIDGYYEYVTPPLEGFWWQDGVDGVDYSDKSSFHWISVLRLPDFVKKEDFDWAVAEAERKKKLDCSKAEFITIEEGLCVQIMHMGTYDSEPETVAIMHDYIEKKGYRVDITHTRLHHEIYLSDPRKISPTRRKTVIRHPIKKVEIRKEPDTKTSFFK